MSKQDRVDAISKYILDVVNELDGMGLVITDDDLIREHLMTLEAMEFPFIHSLFGIDVDQEQ